MLAATPTKTLRRPEGAPKGMAINTTTRQVHGPATRAYNCVSSMARVPDRRRGCSRLYWRISVMERRAFLAALMLLSWLILISLLICSGVSENSAITRRLVCSQGLGESGDA